MLYLKRGNPRIAIFHTGVTGIFCKEATLPTGRPGGLTWSPDGSKLAFFAQNPLQQGSDIYVLDIATSKLYDLTSGLGRHAHIPCWSPGSGALAFAFYKPPIRPEHAPHIYTVGVSTGLVQQWTFGLSADFTPQFSPDGRSLAFRREGNVWLLSITNRKVERLTSVGGAEIHQGCFSSDGAYIVFEHGPSEARQLSLVHAASRELHNLTQIYTDARSPSCSQATSNVSFVEGGRSIRVVSPAGKLHWSGEASDRKVLASPSLGPHWAAKAATLTIADDSGNIWTASGRDSLRQVTFFPPKEIGVSQQVGRVSEFRPFAGPGAGI